MKKVLAQKQQTSKTQKEADSIQENIVAVEDAHSRRPRCAYFGGLLQMDATVPRQTWHLHVTIDDATDRIVGAWFDTQETLDGYYHVLHQFLLLWHPLQILHRPTHRIHLQKEKFPVPGRGCLYIVRLCLQAARHRPRIQQRPSGQGTGGTPQYHLTIAPAGRTEAGSITTISSANEFLNPYIKEFNERFALPLNSIKSVFEAQPTDEKINLTLAVLDERTVDCDHAIQFQKQHYRMLDASGFQVHYRKGTKTMVIKAFDGSLFCCVNDRDIYALQAIPAHKHIRFHKNQLA